MSLWSKLKNKIAERYEDDYDEDWDDDDSWDYLNEALGEDDDTETVEEVKTTKTVYPQTGSPDKKKSQDWEMVVYSRDHIDIHDRGQRHDYIVSCLEQIAEASREIDSLNYEYNMVTSHLHDMEEIEALPLNEKAELETIAARLTSNRRDKAASDIGASKMPDAKFYQLSSIDGDIEEGIEKLISAEDYQKKIKDDLRTLDNERQAYRIRRGELLGTLEDCQGMAVVCTVAVLVCIFALIILQFGMEMNTSWGYVLAGGAAALFYTVLFVRYRDANAEYKKLIREINQLILLQNKVKVRYVNNTNLLDYLRMKYKVESSKELVGLWKQFNDEKARRAAYRKAQIALDENENELLHILRRYQISDPAIWLNQPEAILDHKEMVEIRHSLIMRRQSLRKRMDYNREVVAANAQNEIKDLAESYPRYANEIMALVEEYDARSNLS